MDEDKQVLLRNFRATLAFWKDTRQKVEESAGAPGDLAEQHNTWLKLHRLNTEGLKILFAHAERGVADETELSQAAGISPDELRGIREILN